MNLNETTNIEEIFDRYDKLTDADKKELESHVTDDMRIEVKRKIERLTEIFPQIIIARGGAGSSLNSMMILGGLSQEYCKEFNCSILQFVRDLKIFERAFMERSIKSGSCAFGEERWDVPKKLRNKNKSNYKRIENENKKPVEKVTTASIGDMLKAKGIDVNALAK